MKTKQETFDTVAKALLKQGKPSTTFDGYGCLYRSSDRCKCAAGHLIPDDKYITEMDSADNSAANVQSDVIKVLTEQGFNPEFVRRLQKIHDFTAERSRFNDVSWLEIWKTEMIKFAKDNNLSIKIFDNR
jgi:hypothetical protein